MLKINLFTKDTVQASKALICLMVALFLISCNDTSQDKTLVPVSSKLRTYSKTVIVHGQVSDETGPLKSGKLTATSEGGTVITTTELSGDGRYSVEIPAGTALPVVLTVASGAQTEAGQVLQVVIIEPTLKKYDISRLTTEIARKARSLGGYTYTNLKQAAMESTPIPDANKTTGGFKGDPTKQYGGWH